MRMPARILYALLALELSAGYGGRTTATAAEWGTLKARFVFDGVAPQRSRLALNKDVAVCSKNHPLDEELIVHPRNRGIQNVVVWLELKRGDTLPAVHPSYETSATDRVVLTNRSCRFDPRITLLRTTQTLALENDDPIAHSTVAFLTYNQPFNYGVAPSGRDGVELQLTKVEKRPAPISCPIHSWMKAWLLVQEHPYMAVSNEDGQLAIRNIPPGQWTFRFWHEEAGYLKAIPVNGQRVEDRKGRYALPVTGGQVTDLGEVPLSASDFD